MYIYAYIYIYGLSGPSQNAITCIIFIITVIMNCMYDQWYYINYHRCNTQLCTIIYVFVNSVIYRNYLTVHYHIYCMYFDK